MPRGSQTPRIEHVPPQASSAGQDVVDFAASAGLVLDPWQQLVLRGALGERPDGQWSAFEVGLVVSRQNGKGAVLEALVLAWMFLFDENKVLFSAHEMKTAVEMYKRIRDLVRNSPDLHQQVKRNGYYQSNERTAIELADGREVRFVARSKDSGRGFSADKIVFDEAYNLPDSVVDAMMPTVGARPNPQIWYTSSAGDKDLAPCDVLARIRRRGIRGEDRGMAYFEWSVEYDEVTRKIKGDPHDPRLWAQANPSMGFRKTQERIGALAESMSPEGFAREELSVGNWPDDADGELAALNAKRWGGLLDPDAERGESVVFGVDVAEDRSAWVAVAWRREDGAAQVQLVQDTPKPAFALVDWCAELAEKWGGVFVAPRAFEEDLERQGVQVEKMSGAEFAGACGDFFDAIEKGEIRHGNQAALNTAVRVARWRAYGTAGEKAWQMKDAPEVGPLVAATRALYGLTTVTEGVLVW